MKRGMLALTLFVVALLMGCTGRQVQPVTPPDIQSYGLPPANDRAAAAPLTYPEEPRTALLPPTQKELDMRKPNNFGGGAMAPAMGPGPGGGR